MNFSARRQNGLTFISIVFILGLLAFFVLMALKIGPIYLNHSKVTNALAAVENMDDVQNMGKRAIYTSLEKRFGMNYVEHVEKEDIVINARPNYVEVVIEYEVVQQLFGNLSVLVEFYEQFEAGTEE